MAAGGCHSLFGLEAVPDAGIPGDAPGPDALLYTRTYAIANGDNDALQDPDGTVLVAYNWISLYSPEHWGALRFTLADVPQGATIHAAHLEVYVDSTNEDTPVLTIATEASAAPALPDALVPRDISTRVLGQQRVTWSGPDIGSTYQPSPPVTALVAERVADPAWTPGSSILFVLDGGTNSNFEFRQYDFNAGLYAAKLHVTYSDP